MENDPTLGLSHIAANLDTKVKVISHKSSNQDEQETYLTFLRITNGLDSIQVYSELCITSLFLPSMPLQMPSRRTCACRAGTTSRAIRSCHPIRTPQCRDVIGRTRYVTEIGMRQPWFCHRAFWFSHTPRYPFSIILAVRETFARDLSCTVFRHGLMTYSSGDFLIKILKKVISIIKLWVSE